MHPTIFPPTIDKIVGHVGLFNLVWQPVTENENSVFKSVELRLQIDVVSYTCEVIRKYTYFIKYLLLYCMQCSSLKLANGLKPL